MTAVFDEHRRLVAPLAERFAEAGFRLYLVGGAVRDSLLAARSDSGPAERVVGADMDLTTDATPDQTKSLVGAIADAVWLQGQRFGTIGARISGTTVEITTHRAEVYVSDSRKPVVAYSTDLVEDLGRRDFTVNAMAVDLADGSFHDPHGGRRDLDAGVLRTPLDPETSFTDDPLRMLRAARFVARFGFTPEPGLVDAARRLASRLEIVSAERVRDELFRLLALPDPGPGLALLLEADLLVHVLPEIVRLPPAARSRVLGRMAAAPADAFARLAVLGLEIDEPALAGRVAALRLSGQDAGDVLGLARTVRRVVGAGAAASWSDEGVRRLAADAGRHLEEALDLVAAVGLDVGGIRVVVDRLAAVGELDDLGPALDGAAVMGLLGLREGREVGEAMAWLTDLRLRAGLLDAGEVADRLSAWWAER